jgi:hypothetical protein
MNETSDDLNPQGQGKQKSPEKVGFFQRIINIFLGNQDPVWEKRRLLREIEKILKKTHQKFYAPKNSQVLSSLAKYFYEFYKTLGPAHSIIQHADASEALKMIIIESYLKDDQLEMKNRFLADSIRDRAKYTEPKKLAEEVKEELITYFAAYDAEKIRLINQNYSFLRQFLNLAHFDYYFLLKKFDTNLPEGNFFYKPSFDQINGEYIVDELKDFLDIALSFDKPVDWDPLLDVLKDYKGVEVVSRNGWKKLLQKLAELQKTRIFEFIIKHIDADPYYKPKPAYQHHKIVEGYLSKIKTQTEMLIQKFEKERQTKNIDDLCIKIFGTTSVSRMKYYTEKMNEVFKKKILGGFIYIAPLNFLKAFLIDFCKKTVREVVDLLIVKGKWTTNILSQQLSDSFQMLIDVTDDLVSFDESLAEESPIGLKLKTASLRADKDKSQARILRQMLKEINDHAKKILFDSAQGLIGLAKNVKQVLDDYSRQPPELIINWKEIDTYSDNTVKERLTDVYRKIYYFIKLLQFYGK